MKPISYAGFKKVQKMTLNQFNIYVKSIYESGFKDGITAFADKEATILTEVSDERLMEILLSIKGIGQKRAEKIMEVICNEGKT